jgi:hypothetical protein
MFNNWKVASLENLGPLSPIIVRIGRAILKRAGYNTSVHSLSFHCDLGPCRCDDDMGLSYYSLRPRILLARFLS